MFDYFDMKDNHDEREVAHFNGKDLVVDTCLVTDSTKPYETAISHPAYNQGRWVVVELYETKEEAQQGHDKWVATMTGKLPLVLKDASTSGSAKLVDAFNKDTKWREHYNT